MGILRGKKALVTSGPTYEPIDPVRFLGNRSSGRQGHAIASALARAGAEVILVCGPVSIAAPLGVRVVNVETACEMLLAVEAALPVDIAIFAAAVADWRVRQVAMLKLKKSGEQPPILELVENPDILKIVANHATLRPKLVIGFAAETENMLEHAHQKRRAKAADWLVANLVAEGAVFGEAENEVTLVTQEGAWPWPRMSKDDVAERLVNKIIEDMQQ